MMSCGEDFLSISMKACEILASSVNFPNYILKIISEVIKAIYILEQKKIYAEKFREPYFF